MAKAPAMLVEKKEERKGGWLQPSALIPCRKEEREIRREREK